MKLTEILSEKQKRSIRNILGFIFQNDLNKLSKLYRPSKGECYDFLTLYQKYFKKFKFKKINFFEIGVGGYEDPNSGGGSLRMWKKYFPFANIFSIDINDKNPHEEKRIKIFQGSQSDIEFLKKFVSKTGKFDIIIDDGSHNCNDVITSFNFLFQYLNYGGIYVIEDTQTSYWEVCNGSMDINDEKTTMNYFKKLTDGINHEEFPINGYEADYFDKHIITIHFYHNIIFIEKGDNNKGSNVLKNNVLPTQ